MPEETFGQRIKRLREEAGLSQPDLAKATGIPLPTLRNWEQGRRGMSLESAVQIALALGVSLDHLAGINSLVGPRRGK